VVHLDTSFLIQALVAGSSSETKLLHWLSTGETVGISTIAWSEFLCGPLTSQDEALARSFLTALEPFLLEDARKAAELFRLSGRRSRSLADCQIAAVALRLGARVATANAADIVPFEAHRLLLV
jgi:predicted nucleic acid-binding protein